MKSKSSSIRRWLLFLPLLLLLLTIPSPAQTRAASKPATITSCALTSSKKVKITATISNTQDIKGKKVYLFALSLSDSKLTKKMKPAASKTKARSMSFSVPLNQT